MRHCLSLSRIFVELSLCIIQIQIFLISKFINQNLLKTKHALIKECTVHYDIINMVLAQKHFVFAVVNCQSSLQKISMFREDKLIDEQTRRENIEKYK